MPLFDGSDPAHWAAYYSAMSPGGPGFTVADRAGRWARIQALGVSAAHRILIAGSGQGHTVAAAHAAGFPLCWGIDNSSVLNTLDGRFTVANGVLYVDRGFSGGGAVLARMRAVTGDDMFDWIVTDDMLSCYDPDDLSANGDRQQIINVLNFAPTRIIGNGARTLDARVVHVLSIPGAKWNAEVPAAPMSEWSIEQWAALAPAQTWLAE